MDDTGIGAPQPHDPAVNIEDQARDKSRTAQNKAPWASNHCQATCGAERQRKHRPHQEQMLP